MASSRKEKRKKKPKDDGSRIVSLRLNQEQQHVVLLLAKLSGENPHAVLRVLLAVGTLRLNAPKLK